MIYSTKEGSHFWDYVARCNSTSRSVPIKQISTSHQSESIKKKTEVDPPQEKETKIVQNTPITTESVTRNSMCAKLQTGGSLLERMRQAKQRRAAQKPISDDK